MISAYDASVFTKLKPFNTAKQSLDHNKTALNDLGSVICRHGLQDKVGIALLHKHFDVQVNERLVEEFTENKLLISPCSAMYTEAATPYMWKFQLSTQSDEFMLYPLEFVHPSSPNVSHATGLTKALSENKDFVEEFATELLNMNLLDVFGITALHRDSLEVHEDEVRLETTNYDDRLLTISVASVGDIDHSTLTETQWTFTPDKDFKILGLCSSHCFSHCQGHN